jgi:glycosyltransferase involved in cell wall biosynthesis
MTKIRVLALVDEVDESEAASPRHGSAAHVAATVAGLRSAFDTHVLFGEGHEPAAAAPSRSRRVPVPSLVRGARRDLIELAADRRRRRRLDEAIAAFRPDVLYERSRYLSTAGLDAARAARIPLVLEVNGLLARDTRTMYRSPLEPLGAAAERRKLRAADAVVTVSVGLARLLVEAGAPARNVSVVPNAIDRGRVRQAARTVRPDSFAVGWIGHLMSWHVDALELLVASAPSILARVPEARFVVVGGGPGLGSLKDLVERRGLAERFTFTGPLDPAGVVEALEDVDVGVIPAVFDYAFPVKLVEMGAAGLPVVSPHSESLDEMVPPGVEYEPFEPGSAEALAVAVSGLLLDPERRDLLGRALLEAVRTRYTWDAVGELLRPVVERVLLPTPR